MSVPRVLIGTVAAVALAALVGLSYLQRLGRGAPYASGELRLAGLSSSVTVLRDSLGIPHLWAASEEDLFRAQGWITAQDRLWQMEQLRRVAEGRLSELFGETTLESDRFLRTLGMAKAARRNERLLGEEERRLLRAYAEGVNEAIGGWRGPLPPEFVLLGTKPEPWSVVQLLSIEKVMAWDLAAYGGDLNIAEARSELSDDAFEVVRPRYPAWAPTIVDGWPAGGRAALADPALAPSFEDGLPARESAPGAPGPARPGFVDRPPRELLRSALPPPEVVPFLEAASTVRASNAWVVGPDRSRSGKPILANDMHLGLDAPNVWYLVGLHAPGLDVVGMSLPGSPGVVAGHTKGIAWGFTNASTDDSDFFLERYDPADSSRYLTPSGSAAFVTRREVVEVRGRRPDTVLVRETRHGPVVGAADSWPEGDLLSLRWAAHDPSRTARALIGMNRAESVEELLAALPDFDNPHQNVVFADTAGRWGYWMAGRVPLRAGGRAPVLPTAGWTGEHDWVGDLSFEEHPHALEPEEGFVVTANNRQSSDARALLVSDGTWADPYRAIRIRELIEARDDHDVASNLEIQLDVTSAFAARHAATAARAFREEGFDSLADALAEWDGSATLESREATLFHTWVEALRLLGREEVYGTPSGYFPTRALDRALETGWLTAERLREAARRAQDAFLPWGESHLLDIGHPLGEIPVLEAIFDFGRYGIPRQGTPHSPNVASYAGVRPPFRVSSGPSQRHVVDLADPDAGGFILPGGQSGLPGSAHAWDQLPRWRAGELVPLPLDREAVDARTTVRLTLVPSAPIRPSTRRP